MEALLESYKEDWIQIVQPNDFKYGINDLGPKFIHVGDRCLERIDFTVKNKRG